MSEEEVRLAHRINRLEKEMSRQIAIIHLVMACMLGISVGALVIVLAGFI